MNAAQVRYLQAKGLAEKERMHSEYVEIKIQEAYARIEEQAGEGRSGCLLADLVSTFSSRERQSLAVKLATDGFVVSKVETSFYVTWTQQYEN